MCVRRHTPVAIVAICVWRFAHILFACVWNLRPKLVHFLCEMRHFHCNILTLRLIFHNKGLNPLRHAGSDFSHDDSSKGLRLLPSQTRSELSYSIFSFLNDESLIGRWDFVIPKDALDACWLWVLVWDFGRASWSRAGRSTWNHDRRPSHFISVFEVKWVAYFNWAENTLYTYITAYGHHVANCWAYFDWGWSDTRNRHPCQAR